LYGLKKKNFKALSATAVKNVKRCRRYSRYRRYRLRFFTAVADSAYNFLTSSPIALKNVSDVGDSAKKYKTAIFKPKPSKF
jgi:hypothetical protein